MSRYAAALLICFTATVLWATPPVKPAWQWTLEERLQSRFDPNARRARVAAAAAREARRTLPGRKIDHSRFADEIDGKSNPELFVPTELFESLVYSGFVSLPRVYGRWVRQQTDDLFADSSEWDELGRISAGYAAVLRSERALLDESATAAPARRAEITRELDRIHEQLCAAEATALRAARRSFGSERLDRFLYTVIAPSGVTGVSDRSDAATEARALRLREERCQ
jgi:hypothetical protein